MQVFNDNLETNWNAVSADISNSLNNVHPSKVVVGMEDEDEDFIEEYKQVINAATLPEVDDIGKELGQSDPYLTMELGIPRGDDNELEFAKVTKHSTQYEVQFHNGDTEVLTANIIAENLLSQVDDKGGRQVMLDEIVDHRILDWLSPRDGSTDWIALKDLKESYLVELAEYAVNSKIDVEPAFAWWVPYTMKKRDRIISKVKSTYWARTHKYGIRVPKNIKEAKEIDLENGDTHTAPEIARMDPTTFYTIFKPLAGTKHCNGSVVAHVIVAASLSRVAVRK
eukprot:scaffold46664_cov63-Attheya_sp.AAC.5